MNELTTLANKLVADAEAYRDSCLEAIRAMGINL